MSNGIARLNGFTDKHFLDLFVQDKIILTNSIGPGYELTENDMEEFAISRSGLELLTLDASGNLVVTGTITGSALISARLQDADNTTYIDVDDTPETIDFATSSTIRMIIDSSGDILMNEDLTITKNLTVNGTQTILNVENLQVEDPLTFIASANSADILDTGYYAKYNDGSDRFTGIFRDSTNGAYRVFDNLTVIPTTTVDTADGSYNELFTILSSGNVGINKIAPTSALDVVGNTFLLGTLEVRTDTSPNLLLRDVGGGGGETFFGNSGHGVGRNSQKTNFTQTNDVVLFTAGNVGGGSPGDVGLLTAGGYLKIESESGRVGINVDPTHPLDVVGNINTTTEYLIGGAQKLTATTLGALVVNSSLENVGTLTSLTISGDLLVDTNTLFVDSTNNRVGIGELSPGTSLHITTSGESRIKVEATASTSNATIELLNTTGRAEFGIAGANGNFGTGVLDGDTVLRSIADNIFIYSGTNANLGMKIATTTNNVAFDSDTLFIDAANDRVGINTTSPSDTLEVTENANAFRGIRIQNTNSGTGAATWIQLDNNDGTSGGQLEVYSTGFTSSGGRVADGVGLWSNSDASGGLSIGTLASSDLRFYTAGQSNERMRIDTSGKVGIGTTNPTHLLSIEGANPQVIIKIVGSGGGGEIYFGNSDHGVGRNTGKANFTDSNDVVLHTVGSGDVGMKSGNGFVKLNGDGNFGIDGEPTQKLHVFGGNIQTGANADNNIGIFIHQFSHDVYGGIEIESAGGSGEAILNFGVNTGRAIPVGQGRVNDLFRIDTRVVVHPDELFQWLANNVQVMTMGSNSPNNLKLNTANSSLINDSDVPIAGELPYFSMRDSTQTIPITTYTTVDFTTIVTNRGGFSESAGVITLPSVGLYKIDYTIKFTNSASGSQRSAHILVNGIRYASQSVHSPVSLDFAWLSGSATVNVTNVSQTVVIQASTGVALALHVNGAITSRVHITRIGNDA